MATINATLSVVPRLSPNKSKMADGARIEFRKNANIVVLGEDSCAEFRTKMQHGPHYGQLLDGFQPM